MRRFLALLAFATLGACSSELDKSTRPENIVGDYHLVTFGGAILPATIRADSVNLQVIDGTLTLASNGEWTEVINMQVRAGGATQVQAITTFGSWNNIRQFGSISFFDKVNSYQFSGTASGAMIVTNTIEGDRLVYRR